MKSRSMTRPCLCGLAGPWRLFGFTAREAMGGAPSFDSVSRNLGPRGLPPTFTSGILGAGGSKIQGGLDGPLRATPRIDCAGEARARTPAKSALERRSVLRLGRRSRRIRADGAAAAGDRWGVSGWSGGAPPDVDVE